MSNSMKAVSLKDFGGVENFELTQVAKPLPGSNELLIRIRATSFNPIDYQMRQGSTESKLLKSPILGRELSGEIIQVGDAVSSFEVGDKVAAYVGSLGSNGTYAEYISVNARLCAKIPPGISYEVAAALPMVGMTALQCFNRVMVQADKAVFIAGGAGGVGSMLIKLLLEQGNANIYTTAGNAASISHLEAIGVDPAKIIDYTKNDLVSTLQARQQPFEYVIDLVGGRMSEICAEMLAVFGTYADVTFLATAKARELLFDKAASIVNIANYAPALGEGAEKFDYYGKSLNFLFGKLAGGLITAPQIQVIGNLSVASVQKAHLMLENNQSRGKKIVMKVDC